MAVLTKDELKAKFEGVLELADVSPETFRDLVGDMRDSLRNANCGLKDYISSFDGVTRVTRNDDGSLDVAIDNTQEDKS